MKALKEVPLRMTRRSPSKRTHFVYLEDGEVDGYGAGYAVADDVTGTTCGRIRQFETELEEDPYITHNQKLRKLCARLGAVRITCPGDFTPLVRKGYIAVADYTYTGTGYFLCPKEVYDKLPFRFHLTREEEIARKLKKKAARQRTA